MFCGPSKAGKTSFNHLLRNVPLSDKYTSTPLGETQQILTTGKVDIKGTEWNDLDIEKGIKRIAKTITTLPTMYNDFVKQSNAISTSDESFGNNNTPSDTPYNELKNDIPSEVHKPQIEAEDSIATEASKLSPTAEVEAPEIWNMLTLLDTGGQPEFINMLPAINDSTALTFVVFDLSPGYDCLRQTLLAQHSNTKYNIHRKNYSVLNLLQCLLSLVKVSSTKPVYYPESIKIEGNKNLPPSLCIIGTHVDKLGNSQSSIVNSVDWEISKSVNSINEDGLMSLWSYNGKKLIPVDNTIAGNKENTDPESVAEIIRRRVFENILNKTAQYEIPYTWVILGLQLRMKKNRYILISEVKNMCDEIMPEGNKMTETELIEALKFYHSIGVLLYFDDKQSGMSEFVITNQQWLFKNLTKLSTISFAQDNIVDDRILNKFQTKGIFDKQLLYEVSLEIGQIKKESFLQLLIYLKIVAPMDEDGTNYFMPSILPTYSSNTDSFLDGKYGKQVYYNKINAPGFKPIAMSVHPLLIAFSFGTIPRGFISFLTVQLLQNTSAYKFKWELPTTANDEYPQYDNLITLRISPFEYLSLIDRINYLELQIRSKVGQETSAHREAFLAVRTALESVCNKFGWIYKKIRYGFLCHECEGQNNHITLMSKSEPIPNDFPEFADCGNKATKLTTSHNVWFLPLKVHIICILCAGIVNGLCLSACMFASIFISPLY